ncbi:DUF1190 domain-containing protein [Endozoicomonas sp. SCSIO W0465]|uniref:DUF1190 domain-containing protein n=1 Tax=Endozoicomonas sp. SCSIO W0465 TaxID=2918516 RepID=UPI002075E58C|nr:DUF1190 domain-containing protein [Endozoicomonas sp. SCSIO W0465]USE36257.1 DUF1190 domain-containing protein [Endozoicomonas sp. SCSIO W0465]
MKRSKTLQLVIMGTAPLVLGGCTDSSREALVYKDVASCINDGVISDSVCRYEYNKAWQNHLMMAPKYPVASDCQQDFGTTCQQLASGEYIPTMEGFMLAAEPGSNRSSFTVIPLYLGSGGYFRTGNYDRVGSSYKQGKVVVDQKATAKPSLKSTTMKRGGFGSRSAARGSWGG